MAETRKTEGIASEDAIRAAYPEFERLILDRMNEIMPRELLARANADEQGDQMMGTPGDDADISVLDTSADYFLKLANGCQRELVELRDALERIHKLVYGICESCENPIAPERLRRLPAARLCIECQSALERAALTLIPGGRHSTL